MRRVCGRSVMADQVLTREILTVTQANVTEEDKKLGAEVTRLQWKALAVAERYLDFGPESARRDIVKAFISSATRLGAVDAASDVEIMRTQLLSVMSGMADVDKQPIYDAKAHALPETVPEPADDQDSE